jgi:L-iditol 2-dehydrogenase
MGDLKEALRYAKDRVEDAIKVVVKNPHAASSKVAAE